jgi:hypothetical protein
MHYLTTRNAKTTKGEDLGYFTGILSLAPHNIASRRTVCPHASPGCMAACLYSAGKGSFSNVQEARIKKTREFWADTKGFVERLADDITSLIRMAKAQKLTPCVRLNGTSDLPWENLGGSMGASLMKRFPEVQFYDYTKNPSRALAFANGNTPANYHLTFSLSETNKAKAWEILETGVNMAAVFSTKKGQDLPMWYDGKPVTDGDKHDLRFLDPKGCIVGLRAKGQAKHDVGGFVLSGEVQS